MGNCSTRSRARLIQASMELNGVFANIDCENQSFHDVLKIRRSGQFQAAEGILQYQKKSVFAGLPESIWLERTQFEVNQVNDNIRGGLLPNNPCCAPNPKRK